MKTRALIVSTLVAALVGTATPAYAYYPSLSFTGLLHSPFAALIMGVEAHYSSQPPQRAQSPEDDCATGAPIRAQFFKDGKWDTIKKGRTNDKGKVKFKLPDREGRYRARAKAYTTRDGVSCFGGVSKVKRHRH